MKVLFSAIGILLSTEALGASPVAGCLDRISKVEETLARPQPVIACTLQNPDAAKALQGLCDFKSQAFKAHYQAYLKYKQDRDAAFSAFTHATDPAARMQAETQLNNIERDWPLFGYQGEISELLNSLSVIEDSCAGSQPGNG